MVGKKRGCTCDDDAFPIGVKLRAACSAKHLHDIQRGELPPRALDRVVDLSSLDDDSMRR